MPSDFRNRLNEEIYSWEIPGKSMLHGPTTWFLPIIAMYLMHGFAWAYYLSVLIGIVWFIGLPLYDRYFLRRAPSGKVNEGANVEKEIQRKVSRPTGALYGILMAIVIGVAIFAGGATWTAFGYAVIAALPVEIAVYLFAEYLWWRSIGVCTRLRLHERRYEILERIYDRDGTIADLRGVAPVFLGENYERTQGWGRPKTDEAR